MHCPRCQHENPAGARFCNGCGARVEEGCAHCGQVNPSGSRFCSGCGAQLRNPGTAAPQPHFAAPESYTPKHLAEKILTSKAALEGERKQVTVLFADMKDSMELLADRDPEEARKLLDPILELMMEAVHRYEGTVNQVMGDGIMALFGAPLAHEDHAVRACYAALRMQEAVKKYAEGARLSHGTSVHIRVGINSGEVVVRAIGSDLRMDYTAVGQTTHLAARMEQMAMPGGIFITRATLDLANWFVQVVPLGAAKVKGLTEPIDVYQLIAASEIRSRLQAGATRGLTRFVGRDLEMAQLDRALAQAGDGHGQVVAMVGGPGVGKSRVAHEFARVPRERGWLVLEGSAVSHQAATPYQLFVDVLRAYFGVDAGSDAKSVQERITLRVLDLEPALEPTLPALWALLDVLPKENAWEALDPPQRRRHMLEAVRRLFLRVSQDQPLLLLFEDVHWADSGSQTGLDLLAESLPATRILLLVNYRHGYEPPWAQKSYFTRIRLDPLSAGSMEDLIDGLVGNDVSVAPLRPLLAARTEGNPLFLEETVRTLIDTGALVGAPGGYSLTRPVATVQVPRTVEAILAARIDLLAPEDKRLLQVASAIGRDVPLVILESVAGIPEGALHESLARLQAAEFIDEARLFPDREYRFKHALTHEVAYLSLLRSSRRTYHHRIAEAVEANVPGFLETRPELLAHHWAEAGVNEKAVGLWQRAGRRAIERSAYAEGIRHVTRALEALETLPDTDDRARRAVALQLLLTNSIASTRGYGVLRSVCVKLRELAERVGTDPVTALRLLVPQWMFHAAAGPLPVAHALALQGLSLAEKSGASAWILLSSLAAAHSLRAMGEFSAALDLADRGLRLYVVDEHSPRMLRSDEDSGAYLMRDRAACLWTLGYPDQALTQVRQALEHARTIAHPYTLGWAFLSAARIEQFRGDSRSALTMVEEALVLARQYGFSLQLTWLEALRGSALCAEGRVPEAIATLEETVASLRAAEMVVGLPTSLLSLAAALTSDGRVPEALAVLDEATALVAQSGEHEQDSLLYQARGVTFLRAGDENSAEREFRAAIEVAHVQQARSFELRAATSLAGLLAHQGKRSEARDCLGRVYSWFSEGFETTDLRAARGLLETIT